MRDAVASPSLITGKPGARIRANLVGYVALFTALGGTSYAAIKLPANSVGNRRVKSNAITSGEVRDGALRARDFAAGTVRCGIRGPAGPAGRLAR